MKKLISLLAAFALVSTSFVAEAAPRHKHGVKAVKMHKAKAGKSVKAKKAKKSLSAKKAKRVSQRAYAGPRVAAQ
ncbi:hypothetical protein VX159_12200 [Dechloromonas sp. ZY10]|uniref:hypothetical protein n=1 Tax=Dechloromonas aquae TaxID=2664436 RepID=UPI00352738CA